MTGSSGCVLRPKGPATSSRRSRAASSPTGRAATTVTNDSEVVKTDGFNESGCVFFEFRGDRTPAADGLVTEQVEEPETAALTASTSSYGVDALVVLEGLHLLRHAFRQGTPHVAEGRLHRQRLAIENMTRHLPFEDSSV